MHTISNRREFMKTSGKVVATGVYASHISTAEAKNTDSQKQIPIIDTHQHLWDLKEFQLPWLSGVGQLNRSYVMSDYLKATAGLNVVKAVYMEVDVHPSLQVKEAEYVIDLCQRDDNPTVAAVISGRPASDGFASYINQYKDSPYIKGVRQVLHPDDVPAGFCLQPAFVRSVRLLGELGMSYDLVMRSDELKDGASLAAACPDTRFILDHCGNPDVQGKDHANWKRGLDKVAEQKNVICKLSGIVASADPDNWTADDLAAFINTTIDTFGIDRVIFAGDWPVCTLGATFHQWVTALKTIVKSRSERDQHKIFHDNALQFYGLV